jgi:hypothetical protein
MRTYTATITARQGISATYVVTAENKGDARAIALGLAKVDNVFRFAYGLSCPMALIERTTDTDTVLA